MEQDSPQTMSHVTPFTKRRRVGQLPSYVLKCTMKKIGVILVALLLVAQQIMQSVDHNLA